MFSINNLDVIVDDREIIKKLNLELGADEVHCIMGPNGAGKSSLALALMGHPTLKVSGSIKLNSHELNGLAADERSRHGVFLAFQNPEEIEGVKVSNLMRKALAAHGSGKNDLDSMVKSHEELLKNANKLGMDKTHISRELNVGFSGGEKKRLEMIQMLALKPKVVILDEIDSGLDVDGLKLVAKAINELKNRRDTARCFLIITHYPRILKYVKPDKVHIMVNGKIVETGDAKLAHRIEEQGYEKYGK